MKIKLIYAFAALALIGCSTTEDIPPRPAPQTPVPSQPDPAVPPQSPPPPVPNFKPMAADQCGAAELQHLVGKPRTEIPVPLHPGKRRVVCSTCVMTMDFAADRQTIIFDTDTGLIQSVKCG